MNRNYNLDLAWKILLKEGDEEKAFKLFLSIGEDQTLTNVVRSEGYRGAGEVLASFAPYLGEADAGYCYFKKAIELYKDNLQARISLCDLFFDPEGQFIIKEKEFLENILFLLKVDFEDLNNRYNIREKEILLEKLKECIKIYFQKNLKK